MERNVETCIHSRRYGKSPYVCLRHTVNEFPGRVEIDQCKKCLDYKAFAKSSDLIPIGHYVN